MPEKVSTGVALGTSATSSAYWFTQFLDKYTPNQWAAIGVIGSLAFGFLTLLVSIYFQWRADQRKASRGK